MTEPKQINPGDYAGDLIEPESKDEAPPPQPFQCAVSSELFLRVWQARSTDKDRKRLHGVFVEPCPEGGAILTATTGALLITVRDPFALVKGSGTIILNDLMIRACKPKKSDIDVTERVLLLRSDGIAMPEAMIAHIFIADPDIERDNAMALFDEPTELVACRQYDDVLIHEEFPDWRKTVPDYGPEAGTSGACVDAALSRVLCAALTAPGGKKTPLSWFAHRIEPTKTPVLVRPPSFNLYRHDAPFEGFGIVMPFNSELTADLPRWART